MNYIETNLQRRTFNILKTIDYITALTRITLILFLLFSQISFSQTKNDEVVLKIDNYSLTAAKLQTYYESLSKEKKAVYESAGDKTQNSLRNFLDDVLARKLFALQAEKEGFKEKPEVKEELDLSTESILFSHYFHEMVVRKMITDELVEQYYKEYPALFSKPTSFSVAHIIATPAAEIEVFNTENSDATSETAAKDKIFKIYKELEGGADFAELARRYSEDASAAKGGDLGILVPGKMIPEFEKIILDLKGGSTAGNIGQYSKPFQTSYGWHIVKVKDRLEGGTKPLAEVYGQIFDILLEQNHDQLNKKFHDLVGELKGKYKTYINEDYFKP